MKTEFSDADVATVLLFPAAGQHGPNVGQAIFSLWMALGSVLGYLSGANAKWHEYVSSLIHPIKEHSLLFVFSFPVASSPVTWLMSVLDALVDL